MVERLQVRICLVRPRVGRNVVHVNLGIGRLVTARATCPSASVGLSRTATPGAFELSRSRAMPRITRTQTSWTTSLAASSSPTSRRT